MKGKIAAAASALCTVASMLPTAVMAQASEPWQMDAAVYLYLPTVGGKTSFSPPGAGGDVGVSASQLLDSLQFAFMGSLGARKGRWGAFTDLMYLDLANSRSATRDFLIGGSPLPAGATADVRFGLEGTVWTLAGSYRALEDPRAPLDVFIGARMLDLKEKLSWQLNGNIGAVPLPGQSGDQAVKIRNWDAVVGVKGRVSLGAERAWFMPYYVDAGGGDSSSTWQALAGVGYAFSWGEVLGTWRYLDYRMGSGKSIQSIHFNGPAVAAVFHW